MNKLNILKTILKTISKPNQFEKKIEKIYIDKNKYIKVGFTDKTRARFSIQYADKLVNGNQIQFKARKNGNWLNPIREPELRVITEPRLTPIKGSLTINYASKFKKEEKRLLQIVNRLNMNSFFSKYSLIINHAYKPNQVEIQAVWFPFYSPKLFDDFFNEWQLDIEKRILETEGIEDFLILTQKSVNVA